MDLATLDKLKEIYKLCKKHFEPRPSYGWDLPLASEINVCRINEFNNIRAIYVNSSDNIVVLVGCLSIDLNSFKEDIQKQVIQSAFDWVQSCPDVPQSIKDIYENKI